MFVGSNNKHPITMNKQIVTTSAAGTHITSMTPGIVIREIAGSYYVCYHFGQGETMSYGRYRTEGGARRSALSIANESNSPIASAMNATTLL